MALLTHSHSQVMGVVWLCGEGSWCQCRLLTPLLWIICWDAVNLNIAMDTDFDPSSNWQFSPGQMWFSFSLWRCPQKKTQVMNAVEWETIFLPTKYIKEQEHFYKFKTYCIFCWTKMRHKLKITLIAAKTHGKGRIWESWSLINWIGGCYNHAPGAWKAHPVPALHSGDQVHTERKRVNICMRGKE